MKIFILLDKIVTLFSKVLVNLTISYLTLGTFFKFQLFWHPQRLYLTSPATIMLAHFILLNKILTLVCGTNLFEANSENRY